MTVIQSHRHITCILNGRRIGGWANENPPYEFVDVPELTEVEEGPDGTMHAMDTGKQGGGFMLKLLSSSQDAAWFLQRRAARNRGERLIYNGSLGDSEQGFSAQMQRGVLVVCPPGIVPGQVFEVTLRFQEIQSSADGARFTPPPALV